MKNKLANIQVSAQAYYDHFRMRTAFLDEKKDTYDASLQLDFPQYYRQSISVGAGLRYYPDDHLLFQLTAFRLRYHNVQDADTQRNNAFLENGVVVIPVILKNVLKGRATGLEADFTWKATDWLRLQGTYSYLHQKYEPWPVINSSIQTTATTVTNESPKHRFRIGASFNPNSQLELDMNLYYCSSFRKDRFSVPTINQHFRLDARIGWTPIRNLELSLVGQNLLHAQHQENISNTLEDASLAQRAFYTKLTYRY